MLANACCKCLLPFFSRKGPLSLSDVADYDQEHNEEEDRLLDSVIESDDEQADPLSPDQIRRYIDESRAKGNKFNGGDRTLKAALGVDTANSLSACQGRGVAAPLVVEQYDDLFDEEFDEEPENVVVGVKTHNLSRTADLLTPLGTGQQNSLVDWIDADEAPAPAAISMNRQALSVTVSPAALQSMAERSVVSAPSLHGSTAWAEVLDSGWRATNDGWTSSLDVSDKPMFNVESEAQPVL